MTPIDPIEDSILALTAARGPDKSICPSEVARTLCPAADHGEKWRTLMTPIRHAAIRLAKAGRIDILRKGHPVPLEADPPAEIRGVIRLRTRNDK